MKNKIIALINQKGGVTKTTTTASLSASLAKKGFRILMVDLDPQSNLSQNFNVINKENNIYNILRQKCKAEPIEIRKNLSLIPSTIDLEALNVEIALEPGREYLLKEVLQPFRDSFDYIFIDCHPSLGLTTMNALASADSYIIPLTPEPFSINGLNRLLSVTEKIKARLNNQLKLEGILITKFEKRIIIHQQTQESLRAYYGNRVYQTVIYKNVSMVESTNYRQSIFDYAPNSTGAYDYETFSNEFLANQ